jgi:hypothetical protein
MKCDRDLMCGDNGQQKDRVQVCWFLLKETGNILKMNKENATAY